MGLVAKSYNKLSLLVLFSFSLLPVITYGSDLSIPNSFSAGGTTSASEMNANFTAVESAVDDNHSRITALESASGGASGGSVFKGFSSGTTTGDQGLIYMGGLCASDFSGSHICSTDEFLGATYDGATGLVGSAWIRYSREEDLVSSKNCSGWTNTLYISGGATTYAKGYGISSAGGFASHECSDTLSVACCK